MRYLTMAVASWVDQSESDRGSGRPVARSQPPTAPGDGEPARRRAQSAGPTKTRGRKGRGRRTTSGA
jgi:hypothetical protein